jgi:D-arabinose 1-dehydrogenase-like Zn-dependent alcohol dehydrogenase
MPVEAFHSVGKDRLLAETQEMLTFYAEKGISADIKVIPMQRIDVVCERMLRSDACSASRSNSLP